MGGVLAQVGLMTLGWHQPTQDWQYNISKQEGSVYMKSNGATIRRYSHPGPGQIGVIGQLTLDRRSHTARVKKITILATGRCHQRELNVQGFIQLLIGYNHTGQKCRGSSAAANPHRIMRIMVHIC